METIKKNINKVIIGIVLIFIATFVFNYMKKEEGVEVVEEQVVEEDRISRKILEALNELDKIKIDYKFFTQNISENSNLISFSELKDFSEKELREKEIGKNNPFVLKTGMVQENQQLTEEVAQEDIIYQNNNTQEVFEEQNN